MDEFMNSITQREGIEIVHTDLALTGEDAAGSGIVSTGVWVSHIGDYHGPGQYKYLTLPGEVVSVAANFRAIGPAATKVMVETPYLATVKNEIRVYIEAYDLVKYLNGMGRHHWTDPIKYQVDLWVRLKK